MYTQYVPLQSVASFQDMSLKINCNPMHNNITLGDISGSVQEMSSLSNSLLVSGKIMHVPGTQNADAKGDYFDSQRSESESSCDGKDDSVRLSQNSSEGQSETSQMIVPTINSLSENLDGELFDQ